MKTGKYSITMAQLQYANEDRWIYLVKSHIRGPEQCFIDPDDARRKSGKVKIK